MNKEHSHNLGTLPLTIRQVKSFSKEKINVSEGHTADVNAPPELQH